MDAFAVLTLRIYLDLCHPRGYDLDAPTKYTIVWAKSVPKCGDNRSSLFLELLMIHTVTRTLCPCQNPQL
jgi:hypothetical protein